jgi:hypothetical protein
MGIDAGGWDRARTSGVDEWDRARAVCVEPGANSSRAWGCRHEQSVHAYMEGELHTASAVETRVWAQTGPTSSAGLTGRVLK